VAVARGGSAATNTVKSYELKVKSAEKKLNAKAQTVKAKSLWQKCHQWRQWQMAIFVTMTEQLKVER
jgi:hypothetical protein